MSAVAVAAAVAESGTAWRKAVAAAGGVPGYCPYDARFDTTDQGRCAGLFAPHLYQGRGAVFENFRFIPIVGNGDLYVSGGRYLVQLDAETEDVTNAASHFLGAPGRIAHSAAEAVSDATASVAAVAREAAAKTADAASTAWNALGASDGLLGVLAKGLGIPHALLVALLIVVGYSLGVQFGVLPPLRKVLK